MLPYDSRAQSELMRSVEHVTQVLAYDADAPPSVPPIPLDLITATLEYDENRAPLAVMNGSLQIPEESILTFLDPRRNIRILVLAGYKYEDGQEDVAWIADLGLRSRVVRRPQNDLVFTATTDEMRVLDYAATAPITWSSAVSGSTAIVGLLERVFDHTYQIKSLIDSRPFIPAGQTETLLPGESFWTKIQDIADRIGARVYETGHKQFLITHDVTEAGSAKASLRTGPSGSIMSSETSLDREDFANLVVVTYTGGDTRTSGYAQVKDGPFGTNTIGPIVKSVQIDGVGNSGVASQAAANLVARASSRGRSMSLECANAMYWLRPLDTVTVQLPTGPQSRHLISAVTFDLPNGTMNVRTRQPENVIITTGE